MTRYKVYDEVREAMAFEKRTKLCLSAPLYGRLTIIQIHQRPIQTKYALMNIVELEKSQMTFESPLILPTDHKALYDFQLTVFGRLFHSNGRIRHVKHDNDTQIYTANILPINYAESEMLYTINRLALEQNKEFGKLAKSYDPEWRNEEMIVDYTG